MAISCAVGGRAFPCRREPEEEEEESLLEERWRVVVVVVWIDVSVGVLEMNDGMDMEGTKEVEGCVESSATSAGAKMDNFIVLYYC